MNNGQNPVSQPTVEGLDQSASYADIKDHIDTTNQKNWEDMHKTTGLAEVQQEKDKENYDGWKEHFGTLADLKEEEEKENYEKWKEYHGSSSEGESQKPEQESLSDIEKEKLRLITAITNEDIDNLSLDTLRNLLNNNNDETEETVEPEEQEEDIQEEETDQEQEEDSEEEISTQEEEDKEREQRSERIAKLYKIIGGVAGFSAGALAGSAIVSSSILWFPVVAVGAIAITPKVEQKVKNLIINKFFNKRGYEQLEQRIQNAGDNETEKQSLQAELQRREAALEKFQAASSSFFKWGTRGLIVGGVMGAAPSGTMTPGMYTEGIAVEGATAEATMAESIMAEGAIAETEAITSIPETINVNDFSGGQEYTQYIEGLKEQNLLKGDNLLLTQELGGNIAQAQGELLKGVTEAGIPTDQINGRVFMNQIIELNRALANNLPFNLQGMVQTVINASVPIT